MMTKSLWRLSVYYLYVLVVWGSFRLFVRLPEAVTELWFKPVIWLVPLIWWGLSMKKRLELFAGHLMPALGWGLVGGAIYLVLLRLLVGIGFSLSPDKLGIGLATALVEELTFAGVVLTVLYRETKREGMALALSGLAFALVHLPVNVFVYRLELPVLIGAFCLAFFIALINGFLRLRSNNVLSAVLAHFIFLVLVLR
jgi:membrane protease YdiL (CAAX protease family)